jgi:ferredoxin--NADP+ reductase
MPYVVTQSCCSDASCVVACPGNCIHPAPGEPGFAEAEMVYVDPETCVDCGACATACPVGAVKPHTSLGDAELPFLDLNRLYYAGAPHADRTPLALVPPRRTQAHPDVRVAVVGAGPAGMYAADELLRHAGVSVDVYDRLPTPYGLARAGVAPDHQDTRGITDLFRAVEEQPGFRYRLNVEVGTHVSHDELAQHYHAVVYTVGAAGDAALGIPGERLPGSLSATAFVGWYNGHPDHADAAVTLDGRRVVVVGNGNVALDTARILTAGPGRLHGTDIAASPLAALDASEVREVVVVGRRGPAQAAFTVPELLGLVGLAEADPGLEIVVDTGGVELAEADGDGPAARILRQLSTRRARGAERRIVLRFFTVPVRILGAERVTGVELAPTRLDADGRAVVVPGAATEALDAAMVLRSVGYRGRPVAGLPFDEATATVPNERGRVRAGTYVAGWIKRGPTGFLGTNKSCAEETVASLLDDLDAGLFAEPAGDASLRALLASAPTQVVDLAGWRAIDAEERRRGARSGRPRVKLVDRPDLLRAADGALPAGRTSRSRS